jgi:hypothetical protein
MPKFWVPYIERTVRIGKQGDLRDFDSGLRAAWGNCLLPITNEYYPVKRIEGPEHLAEMFTEAKADAAKRQLPWIFMLPNHGVNELPFDAADVVARAAGLEPMLELDEMTGDAANLAPPRRPLPAVNFQRIQNREQEAAGLQINIAAYGMPN